MLSKITLLALLPFALQAFAAPASSKASGSQQASADNDLKGSCAPGGNFDLSDFTLQLPIGQKFHPTQVSSAQLAGCKGYQDPQRKFFFTDGADGAMVMKVPGSPDATGCVTTQNSKHCRTELRESGSWDPRGATNRLSATLQVPAADDSAHGTVVGQIHIDDSVSSKPVAELYINRSGQLAVGVEQTRAGGNEVVTPVGQVTPGARFSYEIAYENDQLSVAINGAKPKVLSTYKLDAPKSYFKAGNYNQGKSASEVHFFSVTIKH